MKNIYTWNKREREKERERERERERKKEREKEREREKDGERARETVEVLRYIHICKIMTKGMPNFMLR